MFKVITASLKIPNYKWQEYLINKKIILCTSFGGGWAIIGIEGEKNLDGLCEFDWNKSTEDAREYETLEGLKQDVELSNWSYCLEDAEIEIISEQI